MTWFRFPWSAWWRQKALHGAAHHLRKQHQWGPTRETADAIGQIIGDGFDRVFLAKDLRSVRGQLAHDSIDALLVDLNKAIATLKPETYVDEKLHYVSHEPRTLYHYLTTLEGLALNPKEAWVSFHSTVCIAWDALDEMVRDETSITDRTYFLRRYGTLWQEIYTVYRLFAELAGYTLPFTELDVNDLITRK